MNKAFTLVELAIVIVIIGLLVGGVLQGQELIKQTQIRNNIKRITEINSAITTFVAKYNCLPADCANATAYGLTNNGNGDGMVMFTGEHWFFWLHLVGAKMLNVIQADGTPFTPSTANMIAKFKNDRGSSSGYMYASYGDIYAGNTAGWPWPDANGVNIGGNVITVTSKSALGNSSNQDYATFTAEEASAMDTKMDDGNALSGKFYGANALKDVPGFVQTICSNNGVYNISLADPSCRILFQTGF